MFEKTASRNTPKTKTLDCNSDGENCIERQGYLQNTIKSKSGSYNKFE